MLIKKEDMFNTFKPINDNILVELEPKETKSASGIYFPTEAQEKTQKATVLHAGKSEQLVVGNKIFFKKYMGTALDDKYLVLREEDILGIL
jgi:chaperonin GroES